MSLFDGKRCRASTLICALAAVSGCSGAGSSGNSGGKWLEGTAAQGVYEAEATIRAVNAGSGPFSADTSCEAIIEIARESLSDPANSVTGIQAMAKSCNAAGLEFANELRCEAGRLQVLCR
ncbi:MAG TPA: hypothetical protein VE175_00485 [Woeseiaceae bacterium]|nr:hypothetical protein [Woeseiaceae bacterium]